MNNIKEPAFWLGVVEDRMDPLMLGRARVRILGMHTHDKTLLPTEDLPWAYKIQPTTSGGISGIGHAAVGVMPGTWVLIQYIDPDKQMPFIVGVIAGLPGSRKPIIEQFELLPEGSGSSSGNVRPATPAPAPNAEPPATAPLKAGPGSDPTPATSLAGQPASSFKVSEKVIADLKKSEGFRNCPYDDGTGVWTIGYGNTYLANGSKVTPNTPCLTNEEGDQLLRMKLAADFEPAVKRTVRAPITQSMYDSMVHLAYNVGPGGLKSFVNESGLNSGNYEQAASHFDNFRVLPGSKVEKGLRNRRQYEKNLFLRDGLPQQDGSTKETAQSLEKKVDEVQAKNPTLTREQAEQLVYEIKPFTGPQGFSDPQTNYPEKPKLDEPDNNRLSRHQNINKTFVRKKEIGEKKGIAKANGKGSWDQSKTPFNAKYPYNNVWQSESGHVLEFDDTAGSERVNLHHRTGTFIEMDNNGTQVNKIVGDGFIIMERNGHVYVAGELNVNVDGAMSVVVENSCDVQINGKATINVHDDADINVASNLNLTVGGRMKVKSGGPMSFDAPRIDLNSNVGKDLTFIGKIGGNGQSSLPPLVPTNRAEEIAIVYEVTEDNPKAVEAYQRKMIDEGLATKEEMDSPPPPPPAPAPPKEEGAAPAPAPAPPPKREEVKPPENNAPVVKTVCGIPSDQKEFVGTEKMGKFYTLANLTSGERGNAYERKLRPFLKYQEADVFCNLKALCDNVLDPLKSRYPNMMISSCYRIDVPPGGSALSQHQTGQAADIVFPGVTREALYDRILEVQKLVPYDQLILEYANGPGWIHISFNKDGPQRKHAFSMNHHKRVSPDMYTITRVY